MQCLEVQYCFYSISVALFGEKIFGRLICDELLEITKVKISVRQQCQCRQELTKTALTGSALSIVGLMPAKNARQPPS